MVDALREARRVLTRSGVLIDIRPVTVPIVAEVVIGERSVWAKTVASYSAPEDVAAADRAVRHAISREWLFFETSVPFNFEIYCDSSAELRVYAAERKLSGTEIPYAELEERRRAFDAGGQAARLRCRRPWMLSTYRSQQVEPVAEAGGVFALSSLR
jgi:hypothetical protein